MDRRFMRICSLLLTVIMIFNMLPMHAMAEELKQGEMDTEEVAQSVQQEDAQIVDEILEGRSEYIKEYQLSNGLHMAAVYDDAVHYEEDGQWKEIDNTLKLSNTRSGNVYTNTAGLWQVSFPQSLTTRNGISITKDGYTLNFRMSGELHTVFDSSVMMEGANASGEAESDDMLVIGEEATSSLESSSVRAEQSEQTDNVEVEETNTSEEATTTEEEENSAPTEETTVPTTDGAELPDETLSTEITTDPTQETATPTESETTPEEIEDNVSVQETVIDAESFAILNSISADTTLSLRQPTGDVTAEMDTARMAELAKEAAQDKTVINKIYTRLSYSDVYNNTDIVFELKSNQVKESVVINGYDASLYGYTYLLDVGELVPVLTETGKVELYDKSGEHLVMVMPAPYLLDAAGAYCEDVQVSLSESANGYVLAYMLPRTWLASEDREWPVVLDPVVQANTSTNNIRDIAVYSNTYIGNGSGVLQCGKYADWGLGYIYVKYDELPDLSAADVIVEAWVTMHTSTSLIYAPQTVEVHKVTGTWKSEEITWTTKPAPVSAVEDFQICANTETDYTWNITDIARGWYQGENTGMMFKVAGATENSTTDSRIQFWSADYGVIYKPSVIIKFRNNNGLESYWDYTSSPAGRAGTGYVNQYTGNMIWTRSDIGFGGNRMPVSISHVYNANDNSNNMFGMGYGWRTNFNQRVYHWDESTAVTDYYVWEDSDGTDHYFQYKSPGEYKDEDGLELTLKVESDQYTITDKYGNKSVFDATGRLISMSNNQTTPSTISITYSSGWLISRITDGVGRKYNFTYSNGLLNRISFVGSGSTELSFVTFGYTGSDLTTVTDKDSKKSTYTYTGSHLLASAQDVDGYKIAYNYTTTTAGKPSRVQKIEEFSGTKVGIILNFAYEQNQTTLTDQDGNTQIIQFNNWGNTVSVQDDQGRAQYGRYALNKVTGPEEEVYAYPKGNQLRKTSKLQNTVGNVQRDTSFENGITWGVLHSDRVSRQISTAAAYHGNKSLALIRNTAGTISGLYSPYFTIPANTTYTFSAYVKTGTGSAGISISDGSNVIYSDFLPANTDWTRLEVSFTNNSTSAVSATARFNTREAGTAYMDCVQIEQAPTASRYNLIENGDFRRADYGWSSYAGRTTVNTPAPATQLDPTVYALSGNPIGTNRINQTIPVKGSKGDCFVLTGWGKADSVPLTAVDTNPREFSLIGTFNYTDGSTEKFYARFNPYVDTWQYAACPMAAKQAYNSIKVELAYDYNANISWFDGIQLYKEEFGAIYTYDDDGNVTEVVDTNKQTTTYSYNDNNDLIGQVLPTGVALNYTYDTHHNVLTASTSTGETYTFTYDTYGNNTSVIITAAGGDIKSQATYTSDGNRLATTKDALNNVTTYDYDANTNVLKSVTAPNGGTTAYTYDNMYRLAKASMTVGSQTLSAEYTYENDLLKTLKTGSTTYSFTYGDFALRTGISAGSHNLASYFYKGVNDTGSRFQDASFQDAPKHSLLALDYGNDDHVQYTYDEQGRVTKQTYEDNAAVTYQYDNNGALASAADSASGITTKYHYDLIGRLGKVTHNGINFSHTSEYGYNEQGNLEQLFDTILGTIYKSYYYYDTDNRISQVYDGGVKEDYSYDNAGRITSKVSRINKTKLVLTESFTYQAKTSRVATLTNDSAGDYYTRYTYAYDANGNITSVSDGTHTTTYTYDKANQLTRENNQAAGKTWVWTYDDAGNLTSRKEYAYTIATSPGTATSTFNYTYGDSTWGDLLTKYGNNTVTSDAIGNTLSDGTRTYTWKHGRTLVNTTMSGKTWTYTYNADGMRTKRVSGNTSYTYYYNGDMLRYLDYDSNTTDSSQAAKLYFVLDASGNPIEVSYRPEGSTTTSFYYYVQNLQGDVVALVDSANGNTVVTYTYDAWGNVLSVGGSLASTLGAQNPFRYRGYVYDTETKLYYLQSRYYNPEMGRFISADALVSTGQGILGNNMFAYCNNNPSTLEDPSGCKPQYQGDPAYEWAWDFGRWLYEKLEEKKEEHYSRNDNNPAFPKEFDPDYFEDWDDGVSANCHQFTSANKNNKKFVSPDGKYEAIYDEDNNLVTDSRDVGTYNYASPNKDPLGHAIKDVLPWIIWGNSPEDSTKWYQRLFSVFGF